MTDHLPGEEPIELTDDRLERLKKISRVRSKQYKRRKTKRRIISNLSEPIKTVRFHTWEDIERAYLAGIGGSVEQLAKFTQWTPDAILIKARSADPPWVFGAHRQGRTIYGTIPKSSRPAFMQLPEKVDTHQEPAPSVASPEDQPLLKFKGELPRTKRIPRINSSASVSALRAIARENLYAAFVLMDEQLQRWQYKMANTDQELTTAERRQILVAIDVFSKVGAVTTDAARMEMAGEALFRQTLEAVAKVYGRDERILQVAELLGMDLGSSSETAIDAEFVVSE